MVKRRKPTGQCLLVMRRIIEQAAAGTATPYSVSRSMGYHLSGRISKYLRWLEDEGWIRRVSRSANEVELVPIEKQD